MLDTERILVVERQRLPHNWLPEMGFVALSAEQIQFTLKSLPLLFMPRDKMENNMRYKQIIPYTVIRDTTGRILCYRREGSEQRLHDLYSTGIGGHVNEIQDKGASVWETIINGLQRELIEETGLRVESNVLRFCGLINEEQTKVGRVHWGLVFLFQWDAALQSSLQVSDELKEYAFCSPNEFLNAKKYEYWSKLALQLVLQQNQSKRRGNFGRNKSNKKH